MRGVNKLISAFQTKELYQKLLVQLEQSWTDGSITRRIYETRKGSFQGKLTAAVASIAVEKKQLSHELLHTKQDLNSLKSGLQKLHSEYKTGSLSAKKFHAREQRLLNNIDDSHREINYLQRSIDAKRTQDIDNAKIHYKRSRKQNPVLPLWVRISAIALVLIAGATLAGLWLGGVAFQPDITEDIPASQPPIPSQPTPSQPPTPEPSPGQLPSLADTIARVQPSIVLIVCQLGYNDFGQGSGVIVDSGGYIITNKHVIDGAKSIWVYIMENGEVIVDKAHEHEAEIIKTHSTVDLALIKITPSGNLSEAELADSDKLRQGDEVIAIGYPLAGDFFDRSSKSIGATTSTRGIVSSIRAGNRSDLIQTDTPINPGNSGGALINVDGYVIGIPTSKLAEEGIEGMGFAIPSNIVHSFMRSSIK
jgi:S1-C subfamily serine protease